jgi:hypothetical protein
MSSESVLTYGQKIYIDREFLIFLDCRHVNELLNV